MNDVEIIKILGSAGGGMVIIFILAKAGLLKLSIGGGNQDEVNGRVEQKLEDLCERMDEVRFDVRAFSDRLTKHPKDEEAEVRNVRDELREIKEEMMK